MDRAVFKINKCLLRLTNLPYHNYRSSQKKPCEPSTNHDQTFTLDVTSVLGYRTPKCPTIAVIVRNEDCCLRQMDNAPTGNSVA